MNLNKILSIVFISMIYPKGGVDISIIGHFPQNEFKEAGVTTGIGLDFNGMYYFVDGMAFGLNLGGSVYYISKRSIPLNYYTDLISITEETSNNIGYGHLFFKIVPFQARIKPYFEGLIGMKNLNTKTKVYSDACTDDPETDHNECEIAKSTNASDNALSYGFGAGLELLLTELSKDDEESTGNLYFIFGLRYLYGNDAYYLKKGSIEFSNPEEGPVETTFNWSNSRTDLLQINIGLHFEF